MSNDVAIPPSQVVAVKKASVQQPLYTKRIASTSKAGIIM